jgi:hypothetical protein
MKYWILFFWVSLSSTLMAQTMPKIGDRLILQTQRGAFEGVNLNIDGRNYILLEQYSDRDKIVILNSSKRVGYVYKQVVIYGVNPSDFYAYNSNLFVGSTQIKQFPDTRMLMVMFDSLSATLDAYEKLKMSNSTPNVTIPVFFNEMGTR